MMSTNCLQTWPSDTVPLGAEQLADGDLRQLSEGFAKRAAASAELPIPAGLCAADSRLHLTLIPTRSKYFVCLHVPPERV